MMTLRSLVAVATLSTIGLCTVPGPTWAVEPIVTEERIVPRERVSQRVEVRDVTSQDGVVSGVLVNRSDRRLRDVRLLIHHLWLWQNELKPGEDRFSRSDYYTVPQEIPPGGTVRFTYRPTEPLAEGRGGHYEAVVEPVGLVEFSDRAAAGAPLPAGSPPPSGETGAAPY